MSSGCRLDDRVVQMTPVTDFRRVLQDGQLRFVVEDFIEHVGGIADP